MWKDPIVAEVHRARAKLLKKFGGDMDKLFDYLKAQEAKHPERIITKKDLDRRRKRPRRTA